MVNSILWKLYIIILFKCFIASISLSSPLISLNSTLEWKIWSQFSIFPQLMLKNGNLNLFLYFCENWNCSNIYIYLFDLALSIYFPNCYLDFHIKIYFCSWINERKLLKRNKSEKKKFIYSKWIWYLQKFH